MIDIHIDTNRFERHIDDLNRAVKRAVQNGLNDTAIQAASAAKLAERAVVSGRLRSSIHHETPTLTRFTYRDRDGKTFSGAFDYRCGDLEAIFGTNVDYAADVNNNPRSMGFGFFDAGVARAEDVVESTVEKYINRLIHG